MNKNIKQLALTFVTGIALTACNSGAGSNTVNGTQGLTSITNDPHSSLAAKSASDTLWTFNSGRVSLVYPQRSIANKQIVNFVMRGDALDTVTSFGDKDYLPALINAVKQADPIDFYKDFTDQTARNIKVIDVKLNGFHGDNEAKLFTNYASGDGCRGLF